jgi:polysaccharide chain length determinant protein (PEP-CTERM system associated)
MTTKTPQTLSDYFDVVRRRWIFMATLLPGAILISVYLAFTLPPMYRSTATLLLEESSIPEGLIKTTVTAYANEHLELVSRQVLMTDNLLGLVEEIDPYPDMTDMSARGKARLVFEDTKSERVDPVTLDPLPESNALSIHYHNPDPQIAKDVVSRLAVMFLSYNRETRARQAADTYSFLKSQSAESSERIANLERLLAEFKSKYGDALPETQVRNQQAMDRLERDLDSLQQQMLLATERKRLLELELDQINPNLFDPAGDWRAELAELRAEYAVAKQRYTADHPDVRRLRRAIESLESRSKESSPFVPRPDNPEYMRVASQLDTVNRELAVLEANASRARQQRDAYERSIEIAPEVEREYSQLVREYDVEQDRFQSIEASLREAALGKVIESEARGDKLTLIRSPYVPNRPYSPNRLGIVLLGIVLGGGLAIGIVALMESSDPTIRSVRDLDEITDIKHLAAIPFIPNESDKRKRVIGWGVASVVTMVAIVFVGSAVSKGIG